MTKYYLTEEINLDDVINVKLKHLGYGYYSRILNNLRKKLERRKKDIKQTWLIDLQDKEMPPIYYKYEGQIDLIDYIIKEIL